jgi:membrane protein YdbS with pleckstrin-like domain
MANNANNSKKNAKQITASSPGDQWRSGRNRFGLSQLRRRDRVGKQFPGQQPDEVIKQVVRKHWWFLVRPALPFIGSVIVLILVLWLSTYIGGNPQAWAILLGIIGVATVATGLWFAYRDLITWWFENYTITNKRLIISKGLFQPTQKVVGLDKVQQMEVDHDFLGFLLHYGTIRVYLQGNNFLISDVPHPDRVKDDIQGITEEIKAKKAKDPEPPELADEGMKNVLSDLAKKKPVPQLDHADEHLPPIDGSRSPVFGERPKHGPRRRFGGPLQIPLDVRYNYGEYTVKYIQRSQYVLLRNLLIPALSVIVLLVIGVLGGSAVPGLSLGVWWFIIGLLVVCALLAGGLIYTNYVDDVYILTNRRMIDIERQFAIFAEVRVEIEYSKIRDIKVQIPGILERILDIGDVFVETPGNNPDLIFEDVDHPFVLLDLINNIKGHKEIEEKANRENSENKKLHLWLSRIAKRLEDRLEETSVGRGAPDLLNKDVITAMAYAQEVGLKVTVRGEATPKPDAPVPPGCVMRQSPPPGTLMEEGSKIEIVLSKS